MAIPFSNTTLRIPRGFGNLLEGLAREVLRSQPKDIPTFAAQYFSALLKEREERGLDPAEWGAKLEDRYYNSHAFKELGKENEADGGRKPQQEAVETVHEKRKTDTPRYFEDEIIQPVHLSTISSANFNVFDEVPGVDSCGPLSVDNTANEGISSVDTPANIEEELIQPAHISTISSANFNVFDDVPGVEFSDPPLIGNKASEGISIIGTPGNIDEELIQPAHISTISSANFNVFDDVPGLEFSDPPLIGNKASEGISSIGIPGNIDEELIQPAHISTISSANFNIFDEVPGVESSDLPSIGIEASEDVCGAELRPSPVAPYGGIANVDICLEGLQVPEPVGDFSLSAALGTPTPVPSPLQVPEGTPAAGSPGSLLLDFSDNDARQTPSSEGVPMRAYVAELMRGEEPGTPEALLGHGDGREENVEATDIDEPAKSELLSKGGGTSRIDPRTGGEEISQLDLPVKALKDDPPSGKAVGSARENESNAADNSAENIQPQTFSTVEAVPISDAASRDTPLMEEVRLSAGEQHIKDPEEPGQGQGSVEQQEQNTELEEKEQGEASEDLDQGAKSEGQNQGTESAEENQGKEPKGQNQGAEHYQRTESEDPNQGEEPQKQNHSAESEEQNQGTEPEEPDPRAEQEGLDRGAELEKQNQRAESKEQNQGAELGEQNHGAESAQQILAVMPEVAMDERDSHVESQDLLLNQNKRSAGDMQEPPQQEAEVVVPVGGDVDQKEACSQPQEEEDVMDIPLDDPEANKAAAKIQAGFRGHMTRKKMKDDKPREENQQDQKD